jgi:hypothetical protein
VAWTPFTNPSKGEVWNMSVGKIFTRGALALLLPLIAEAARPFSTQDAGTLGRGLEAEAVLDVAGPSLCSGVALTRAWGARLDLGLGVCFTHAPVGERSFDGTVLGAKWALIPGQLSLSSGVELGRAARTLELAHSRDVAGCMLDLSAGADWDAATSPTAIWGVALSRDGRLAGLGAELGGSEQGLESWLLGLRWPLGTATLDAGLGGGFTSSATLALTAGLTLGLSAR